LLGISAMSILEGTIERGLSNTHSARERTGRLSSLDERPSVINLRRSKRPPSTQANPTFLRRLDSGLRPLDDWATPELGQSAQ
jgi:hypothetical protein